MSILKTMDGIQDVIKRYRERSYKFPLTDAIKCLYCSQILILAYQTSCGCRYCKNCLDEYLKKGNTKCLGADCEDIENSMPDNAVNREIANLKVSCLFKSEGCHYEDSLRNMNKHLEECEYRHVPCSECQELVTKILLDDHLGKYCPMRNVQCQFCQKTMPLKKLNSTHLNPEKDDLCEKLFGICPNNCGEKNKVLLRNHLSNCKNRPMACPYSEFGCESRCNSLNINQHFTEENWNHTTSLISYFKKEMSALNDKCNRLSKDYKSLIEDRDNLKQEVTRLQQQDPGRSSRNAPRAALNIVKNRDSVIIHRTGIYIWKIEKFKNLRQSAENGDRLSITSEPFYTREFGYKMSMKIYPAGDGVGKGTHLSVFFTLMKGDYDDLLQWPFKNKVTLTILDQKNKTSDYSDTFKPDPRSTCYQKPTEEYNIASGSPKFISFDQLQESFLKDDAIFLKIQVLN